MFLTLWNYLRGYVIIEVSGFSVERFMNLAVHKGIYIWDVVRISEAATMKVSIKGFKLLKSCARKTKCKVVINEKMGLPFIIFKYRKRKILAFGALFFVFILFFLSSFVWLLEVEGNDIVTSVEICSFLEKRGLGVGTFKYSVNERELEKLLLKMYGDISWINIRITGTKATIRVTEAIPQQRIVDTSIACDIIASKDGLIESIATRAGSPKVKQGDVVQKGDVLVSGELLVGTEDAGFQSEYVHAQAEVLAKAYHEIEFAVPLKYIVKNFTGKTKKDHGLVVFENKINLFKPNNLYENYDKITERTQLSFGENYPLPAKITMDEYKEFEPQLWLRSVEEAKDIAESLISGKLISEFDFEIEIVDKTIEYTQTDAFLEVRVVLATIERIDEQNAIMLESEEEPLEIDAED